MNPLAQAAGPPETCSTCVWRYCGGRGKAMDRCRRHRDARIDLAWPACPSWTASLDCQQCGACCREAYHAVEVSRRDPFVKTHPERVVLEDGRLVVRRDGNRCANLSVQDAPTGCTLYACRVYDDRPRTCREFTRGSAHCADARCRIGLTP